MANRANRKSLSLLSSRGAVKNKVKDFNAKIVDQDQGISENSKLRNGTNKGAVKNIITQLEQNETKTKKLSRKGALKRNNRLTKPKIAEVLSNELSDGVKEAKSSCCHGNGDLLFQSEVDSITRTENTDVKELEGNKTEVEKISDESNELVGQDISINTENNCLQIHVDITRKFQNPEEIIIAKPLFQVVNDDIKVDSPNFFISRYKRKENFENSSVWESSWESDKILEADYTKKCSTSNDNNVKCDKNKMNDAINRPTVMSSPKLIILPIIIKSSYQRTSVDSHCDSNIDFTEENFERNTLDLIARSEERIQRIKSQCSFEDTDREEDVLINYTKEPNEYADSFEDANINASHLNDSLPSNSSWGSSYDSAFDEGRQSEIAVRYEDRSSLREISQDEFHECPHIASSIAFTERPDISSVIREDSVLSLNLIAGQHDLPDGWNFGTGPTKVLWKEMPEVVNSGILETLSASEVKIQEALFEIITSESTYIYGLKVLVDYFMSKIYLRVPYVIDMKDFVSIFPTGIFETILKESIPFLNQILDIIKSDVMLGSICSVVAEHYQRCKENYVAYARFSKSLLENCQSLRLKRPDFARLVENLNEEKWVKKQELENFLLLPMQRITRLPLLMKNVLAQVDPDSPNFNDQAIALKSLLQVAGECEMEQTILQRWEIMKILDKELLFPDKGPTRKYAILKKNRHLEVRATAYEVQESLIKRRRNIVELFLFNDVFIIAKKDKKREQICWVTDYCPREIMTFRIDEVEDSAGETLGVFTIKLKMNINERTKVRLVFESNSKRKKFEDHFWPVDFNSGSESPKKEVIVVSKCETDHRDILAINICDILSVVKEEDDWYYGRRLQDAARGWFPKTCCRELRRIPTQTLEFSR